MKIAGIVAEYNPFHTGHAYQIACTRAALGADCAVAAVMSGNWVQGGRPAVLDKWTRARLALLGGAPQEADKLGDLPKKRLMALCQVPEDYLQKLDRNANMALLVTCLCVSLRQAAGR